MILNKLKIIHHKLYNNWSSFFISNKILDYQNKSEFIKFLRVELSKIKDSDTFENQIKKNLLRSISRYSEDLIDLALNVFNEVSRDLENKKDFRPNFLSSPYLMIHLPNDKSEEGTMHSDYENTKDGFVTCWVPLENYNYPALLTLNKLGQIISSFPRSNKLLDFFNEKNICKSAKPGEVRYWSDCYLHKGNRNPTNLSSFVLVTKLSRQTLQIGGYKVLNGKLNKEQYSKDTIRLEKINHNEILKIILSLIKKINHFINEENYLPIMDLIDDFIRTSDIYNKKIISFFLSVQAQRIWLRPKYFTTLSDIRVLNPKKLWIILDLFSISIGTENTSSIQRIISQEINFIPNSFLNYANECVNKLNIEKKHLDSWKEFCNRRIELNK